MSIANPNWSPDGSKIAFNGGPWEDAPGRPGIYVMNADGTNPINSTSAATPDLWGPPIWSPDGTKIAFLGGPVGNSESYNIYVMNADGTNPVNITHKKEGYYGFGGTGAGDTLDWQPLPRPTEAKPEKKQENSAHITNSRAPSVAARRFTHRTQGAHLSY